jgi:hypothetical protein
MTTDTRATELIRLTDGRPYYRKAVDEGWLGLYTLGMYDGMDGLREPRSEHPDYLAGFAAGQRELHTGGHE